MLYFNSPYSFMQSSMYNQGVTQGLNLGYNQVQQNQNNNIIFVQGEVGAKSFQLQPNQSVMLLDNDDSKFYIKTTDSTGMSTLKTYKFEEIKDEPKVSIESNKYVTKEEFDSFKSSIDSLYKSLIVNLNQSNNTATNKECVVYEPDI